MATTVSGNNLSYIVFFSRMSCCWHWAEFKALRRPFSVSALMPFTDVWTYKPVQFYPGKHTCEKPAEMMRDIIAASSKPSDVVADFFMGSGSNH